MLRMLAAEAARRFGGRVAVRAGGVRLTYGDLDRLSDAVAAGYAHRGIRVGDVICVALPCGPEFVICSVAAIKIGAVAAGIDLLHPVPSLVSRLDPAMVVTTREDLRLPGVDVIRVDDAERTPYEKLRAVAREDPPPPPLPPDPHHPLVIVFTSGVTGPPKGVLFGGRQLETIRAAGAGLRWGGGDARLVPTSMAHAGFMTRLPVMLQTGRTVHVLREWSGEEAARVIAEGGIRIVQGDPARLAGLLDHPPPSGVELLLVSGAPAGASLIRRLRAHFGVPVCNRYLCTEAGLGLGTQPDDPPEDAEETVGRPRPGVDLAIRPQGAYGPAESLPTGTSGEVLLRSGAVMSGYVDGGPHERTRDPGVFTGDGFVRTGDLGFVDERGRLHLIGRTP